MEAMGDFVKQHEQHVAGYEFREFLTIFRRQILESRIVAECDVQSRRSWPEISRPRRTPPRRRRLREDRLRREHEHERQKKQDMPSPEEPRCHGSTCFSGRGMTLPRSQPFSIECHRMSRIECRHRMSASSARQRPKPGSGRCSGPAPPVGDCSRSLRRTMVRRARGGCLRQGATPLLYVPSHPNIA